MPMGGGGAQGGFQGVGGIIMLVAMIAVFYFFAIRPQKKREKEVMEMRNAMKPGDDIITIGGICGKIVSVKEDYVIIETTPGKMKIQFTKWAISSVVHSKGGNSGADDEKKATKDGQVENKADVE